MNRLVVGLSGGIATGKSAALKEFKKLGAKTISVDAIAHEQAEPGGPGFRAILRAFGREFLGANGRIDRAALGKKIFRSAVLRRKLEAAVHPPILREMNARIQKERGIVVVDVPLLFEKGLQYKFNATVVVSCGPEEQLRRLAARDKLARAEAARRVRAQWPISRKTALADFTVDNTDGLAGLRAAVRAVWLGLRQLETPA